jgi:hypothetical protein
VRLTAIGNRSRDETDRGVRVVIGGTNYGLTRTLVTIKKACKGGNRLMTDLGALIRSQYLDEVCYNVRNTKVLRAAPLT